jgi:diacylglycerol O-acyltransferase
VRWFKTAGDRSIRGVLDLAQPMAMQGFDRARPLWELAIVEGLAKNGAALILKLHHSLSDGVGLVQMTTSMVETYRTPDPKRTVRPMPPAPPVHVMSQWDRVWDALGHEQRRQLGRARRSLGVLARAFTDPFATARVAAGTAASVARILQPVSDPLSPVMRGRSLSVHFDAFAVPLDRAKAAARAVDGTLNDAFVAGIAGGMRLYDQRHGAAVDELRMTMPINLREGEKEAVAGNQFSPARFAVPIAIADPAKRMLAVRQLVRSQRREPALSLLEDISQVLNRLPGAVATALFGSMLKGIDFVTSNVPGPPVEVYVSGSRIEEIYGFGPLSGAAANITLFSYRGRLGIAVNTDRAAVRDPGVFLDCMQRGMEEVLAVGGRRRKAKKGG